MRIDVPEWISTPFFYTLGFTLPILICWRLARLLTWPEVDPVEFNSHKPFRHLRLVWRQILKIFGMYGEFGKRKYWTIALFLVMYIPLFGEDIPTVVGFAYLSKFKAGAQFFQSKEEWLKANNNEESALELIEENASDSNDLSPNQIAADALSQGTPSPCNAPDSVHFTTLSSRFFWRTYQCKTNRYLPLTYLVGQAIDIKQKRIVFQHISIQSGYPGVPFGSAEWRTSKIWIKYLCCTTDDYENFKKNFFNAARKK